ncbi:alpha/beta hydrolase [Nocardia yamanashiensis]|uniref:alpha/beta hydrolase n=1 Tax=Nocardia yamanashiensis TaxID=209247 RepID=UPI00082E2DD2|nr:alpha/beta hydrolase [Nocardia yamanashiensis]
MTAVAPLVDAGQVRGIELDGGTARLSALLAVPEQPPRATIVAIHGIGMRAGYFHGRALPGMSLLELGAALGFTVVAVDRPGYGASARTLPEGQPVAEQARTLAHALRDLESRFDTGAGIFLHAHSFGGKLALVTAASQRVSDLLGIDVSGCGHRYVQSTAGLENVGPGWTRSWLPLDCYPPASFRAARAITAPIPAAEQFDIVNWESTFPAVAQAIRVPVRFTFAEHERWWHQDDRTLDELRARLRHSPRVVVDRQPDAGHNTSLGYTARTFHLRSLAFAEECIVRRRQR